MSDNIVTIQSNTISITVTIQITISITVTIQTITISITVTVTPQPQPLESLFSLQREHFKQYKETDCCACRASVLSLFDARMVRIGAIAMRTQLFSQSSS
jgi:hypothetical protein